MGFFTQLLIAFVFLVVGELLRPSLRQDGNQPAGLGDFSVPTATENRKVQIVWGRVRLRGPNVTWYGDLDVEPITEEVRTGLFSSETITRGYRYYLGAQLVLCLGQVDEITKLWIGDDLIWEGLIDSDGQVLSINEPDFFGGDDGPEARGGLVGDFRFHLGSLDQAVDPYLATQQSPTPAYRPHCYAVLERGYVGNAPRLDPWSFEVGRYPNGLGLAGGIERIGQDANPVCVLYEIMTNTSWGRGVDPTKLDLDQWRQVAQTVHDEGLGFSMVADSVDESRSYFNVVLRHIDAAPAVDQVTGLIQITLIRNDYVVGDLVVIDESSGVSLSDWSRGAWSETSNEVRVSYLDRSQEYTDRTYVLQDPANIGVQGEVVATNQTFPGCKTPEVAIQLAAREMRSLATPLAKATLLVNRIAWDFSAGQPFVLNWPSRGIAGFVARVQEVRPGTPEDPRIALSIAEDVYGLERAIYSQPQPTEWIPPDVFPSAPLRQRLWEVPFQLSPNGGRNVAALVTKNPGLQLGYEVWADLAGGTNFSPTRTVDVFTPSALLDQDLVTDLGDAQPYTQDLRIRNLSGTDAAALGLVGSGDLVVDAPGNVLLIGDELMFFQTATDNGDGTVTLGSVRRGAVNTIPAPHADGSVVWFAGLGAGLITLEPLGDDVTDVAARFLTFSSRGVLDLAAAPTSSLTLVGEDRRAIPPGDPQINGDRFVDLDWARTPGTLRLTWNTRNRRTQELGTEQTDAPVAQDGSVRTSIRVRRVDNDAAVVTQDNVPGGEFVAQGFLPQSSPGVADESDFYATLESTRAGTTSQQWRSRDFTVFGFGLNFGQDFGGDPAGDGGPVLDQGAAPFLPDPIPGQGDAREWVLTVGGVYDAADRLTLEVTVFDNLVGDSIFQTFALSGAIQSSLEEYAIEIESQLNGILSGRSFTVVRQGLLVRVSTRFGSVGVRQSGTPSPGGVQATLSTRQEAAPPTTPQRQIVYLDWWETEDQNGETVDVLAPSQGSEYALPGQINWSTVISGLTYEAQQALEGRFTTISLTLGVDPLSQLHSSEFGRIADRLRGSPLSDLFFVGQGVITDLDSPMTRQGVTLQIDPNYRVSTQLFDSVSDVAPSGYKLLAKQGNSPVAGDPNGLAQVTELSFFTNDDAGFAGLDYVVEVDGTLYSEEVQAPGDQAAIVAALDALTAQLDAAPGLAAQRTDSSSFRYVITLQTASNVSAEVSAFATFGLRVGFTETEL